MQQLKLTARRHSRTFLVDGFGAAYETNAESPPPPYPRSSGLWNAWAGCQPIAVTILALTTATASQHSMMYHTIALRTGAWVTPRSSVVGERRRTDGLYRLATDRGRDPCADCEDLDRLKPGSCWYSGDDMAVGALPTSSSRPVSTVTRTRHSKCSTRCKGVHSVPTLDEAHRRVKSQSLQQHAEVRSFGKASGTPSVSA